STWASGAVTSVLVISDMVDYAFGELRGRDLGSARHLARQVVCDPPRRDRAREPPDDRVRRVAPAELLEHHGSREQHRPGIDLVEAGVLRGRAVRRLEYREPVADVAAGRHTEPADLRDAGVGQGVTVQIRGGDDGVVLGAE